MKTPWIGAVWNAGTLHYSGKTGKAPASAINDVAMHKIVDPRRGGVQESGVMNKILLEAIACNLCVEAVYNRVRMTLAPHILYTRHDELYVDAVALEKDGREPRELKLGTFKLAGLGDMALTERAFTREDLFDPANDKYAGVTLFAVEAA